MVFVLSVGHVGLFDDILWRALSLTFSCRTRKTPDLASAVKRGAVENAALPAQPSLYAQYDERNFNFDIEARQ